MKLGKLLLTSAFASAAIASAQVSEKPWGVSDGKPVKLYTLSSGPVAVQLTNFGARVVSISVPDAEGRSDDIALGFRDLHGYEADTKTYMGATVGRYGNRIAKGTFSLDGVTYHIPVNNNGNALHGGEKGFDRSVWDGKVFAHGVEFTLVSPDGNMGFPGELTAHVRYTLEDSQLRIDYRAVSSKKTVLNLTNHTYFNLSGTQGKTVLAQMLEIGADRYTPVDATQIPVGELASVANTPFDFRHSTAIGARINQPDAQLATGSGYDHNWVLKGSGMRQVASVVDPSSGRTLAVFTTEPGLQFYSGNFLDGTLMGRAGYAYAKNAGFCVETQHFPDSPNQPGFPSTELRPGEVFRSTTIFRFGVQHKTERSQ